MDQGVIYRIKDWEVDPAACLVSRNGDSVHLEPKAMDLLVFLASKPGVVHSRDELLDEIWPGLVVSDEALTNAIIKLRKAFNDSARDPQFIETLPKRGYRLIADVQSVAPETFDELSKDGQSQSERSVKGPFAKRWLLIAMLLIAVVSGISLLISNQPGLPSEITSELVSVESPSIAVLPFLNIGNNIEDSYFSDGITDDLITDLSSLSGLFVISRNSTFQYKGQAIDSKQVAAALGVRYVLEGSVRRSGNKVRVNTQLIDGQSGGQLWAERYDGEMKDVFALQDRMTEQIIGALAIKLTEREDQLIHEVETVSIEAYDQFLKGVQISRQVTRESFALAEQHFLKALEYDPEYLRAHTELAALYMQIWQQGWHQNSATFSAGWSRAKKHLEQAMKKPDAQTHSLRSNMHLLNRRFDSALEDARVAVSLNANSGTGYLALAEVLSYSGQSNEAIETARKALRLDPKFPAPYLRVEGRAQYDLKRYDQAVATLQLALEASPTDQSSMINLIASLGQQGDASMAQAVLEQLDLQLSEDRLPRLTQDIVRHRSIYQDGETLNHLIAGLAKGGVPKW